MITGLEPVVFVALVAERVSAHDMNHGVLSSAHELWTFTLQHGFIDYKLQYQNRA